MRRSSPTQSETTSSAAMSSAWSGDVGVAPPGPVAPSTPGALALRLALLACFCLAVLHAWTLPAERLTGDLLANLSDGNVETITIERPSAGQQGQMELRVDWSQRSGRDGYAYYSVSSLPDNPQIDEGELILDAAATSPATVQVTTADPMTLRPTLVVNWPMVVALAALLVMVAGPQPRLATKWAWFWLGCAVPPLWAAFLLLEPVPAWRRTSLPARPQRYTAGWAFLLALLLGSLWHPLAPF